MTINEECHFTSGSNLIINESYGFAIMTLPSYTSSRTITITNKAGYQIRVWYKQLSSSGDAQSQLMPNNDVYNINIGTSSYAYIFAWAGSTS